MTKSKIKLPPVPYVIDYDDLRYHVGHKIEINDVWDWHTNRETSIEIRCLDCDCEPLLEVDIDE